MSDILITHEELVKKAAQWLRSRCSIVITEMASQREEPDAIGFGGVRTILIECKVTRADFLADLKKPRHRGLSGMGDHRYYLAPSGLLKPEEIPTGWGLLEVNGRGVSITVKPIQNHDKHYRAEHGLLVSCIRRIGQNAPDGVSVKCYTYRTKNRATLGVTI